MRWLNWLGVLGGVVALAALILWLLRKPVWAAVLAFVAMLVFLLLLVEGLAWAWVKGLLHWR